VVLKNVYFSTIDLHAHSERTKQLCRTKTTSIESPLEP